MKNQFQLFWQRDRRMIWAKTLIIGLSAALLAVGALLLANKLFQLPGWLCPLSIVALPIASGLAFMLQRSSYKKLAKRLDEDFQLNEKVQTMIEFQDSDDEMCAIQRKNAMDKLSEIPLEKMKFKNIWVYIVLLAVASTVAIIAVACPPNEEQPPVVKPEPDRDVTDWEWQALDDLINYVRESGADDYMKQETLKSLYNLKDLLKKGVPESSWEAFADTVITQIRNHEVNAAAQENISEGQLEANREVCDYVVEKLCEIFGLEEPATDESPTTKPDDPGQEEKPGNSNNGGTGDAVMGSNDRLFDDILGYTSYSQVITGYYNEIINAMDEEILSREEWEDYIETYFGYLYGSLE